MRQTDELDSVDRPEFDEDVCASDPAWAAIARSRGRLIRLARRRLSTPEDAEDVVQEAFARALARNDLDSSRIESFLAITVLNLCADFHRQHARMIRREGRLRSRCELPLDPFDVEICDREHARWLATRLELLSRREQQVLGLIVSGLSVGEAATDLKISYKAAHLALARARRRLRQLGLG